MGSINNSVLFGNTGIFDNLEKGGVSANAELQKQFGSYTHEQIQHLKDINSDMFRKIVNYENPKNKGAAIFTKDLTLDKCNNKVDIGSWRIGLNAKKNMLMRQTFANALAPGLKYIADNRELSKLLTAVTGKQVRIAGREAGGEVLLDARGGVFSTEHLERKEIREAYRVYDESFNTVQGRISVLKTMLTKIAEDNGTVEKMENGVLNGLVGLEGDGFANELADRLNKKFGLPYEMVRKLVADMLETGENEAASVVKTAGEYVDRTKAMKLSSDAFLVNMNALERAVNQAAKENDLTCDLVVLLRNYASTNQQLSSGANSEVRYRLESLLPSAIAQFTGDKLENINKPLSAYGSDFGGRNPLNIFMDAQFEKVLNALLDKHSGAIKNSSGYADDFAVGKKLYKDLVEIASGFLNKVKDIQNAYQSHLRTVAPGLFAKPEGQVKPEGKVINLDIDAVEINLENVDKKDVMEESAQNDKFKISCMRAVNPAIKEAVSSKNNDEKVRLGREGFMIVLETMVKTFAKDIDKTTFFKGIIDRQDSGKAPASLNDYGFDNGQLCEDIKKDLKGFVSKQRFCTILGSKSPETGKSALTGRIIESMNDVFNLVEAQFNGQSLFKSLKNLFTSKVDQGLERVASDIFRDEVVSTLLSRFYSTQTEKTARQIENGDTHVNISATYTKAVPLLLAVEELAGKLMDSLASGNKAFKDMMSWIDKNSKKLGLEGKDLEENKKAMVSEYENQLRKTLIDEFEKFDFGCLKNLDINDQKAFKDAVQTIGENMAKGIGATFGNKVASVKTTMDEIASAADRDYGLIHQKVEDAFKFTQEDFLGKDEKGALIPFHGKAGNSEVVCRADKILFGDNGVLKTVFGSICNNKTSAIYLPFTKARSKDVGLTVGQYMKNANLTIDGKAEIVASMKSYLQNLPVAIFTAIQTELGNQIKNLKGENYSEDDVARLAEQAASKFIQENLGAVEDYINNRVTNAYNNCVSKNGKLALPETDNLSVALKDLRMTGKISGYIEETVKSGEKTVGELKSGLKDGDKYKVDGNKNFEGMIDKNDGFIAVLTDTNASRKNSKLRDLDGKYGFLQSDRFESDLYGTYVNQRLDEAKPLEVALMGTKPFCEKIVADFKEKKYVDTFRTYVDDCITAFNDPKTFGYVKAYGFGLSELDNCREKAIYQPDSDAKAGENCLTRKKFNVEDAKKRFEVEVHNALVEKIGIIKENASDVKTFFDNVGKHVQERVDELSAWWEKNCLGVGKEANSQQEVASMIQKAVLKQFNAKFVTELVNQVWLKDGIQDKVIQASDNSDLALGGKDELSKFLNEGDLEKRIGTLNKVIEKMMDGLYDLNSVKGFRKLINEAIEQTRSANPKFAEELDKFYKGNKRESVETLAKNLEGLGFYREMVGSAASKYWNECCSAGVFNKITEGAAIEMKPVEKKPVEKPVEPGPAVIDLNTVGAEKKEMLKNVVVSVLTGGKVAQEIRNVQGDDFKSALEFLNDDAFLRDLYKSLLGTKFSDGVWNDVKTTLKKIFIQKHYANLMSGIEKAFDKDNKTISFAKTELSNEMFLGAYDDVLRARWQSRVITTFNGLDANFKRTLLVDLGNLLQKMFPGDKNPFAPITGKDADDQTVTDIIRAREDKQMVMLQEIVALLPLEDLFASDEEKGRFINSSGAIDTVYLRSALGKCFTKLSQSASEYKLAEPPVGGMSGQVETFEQRLAFYRDFCIKSLDRIETTRASFDNSFSQKYVTGAGFTRLFMSDLFLEDDDITKFGNFGLEDNDADISVMKSKAESALDAIRTTIRGNPLAVADTPLEYLSSFEKFSQDMLAVQTVVNAAADGKTPPPGHKKILTIANNLFGTIWGVMTARNFAEAGKVFGTKTMMGKLVGLNQKLQPLFNAAIHHELDKRAAARKELSEVVNNVNKRNEWRQELRSRLADEKKLNLSDLSASSKIERLVADEELKMIRSYFGDGDLGLTTDEVNDICGKVLDLVVKGSAHKGDVQEVDDQSASDLLGSGHKGLVAGVISELKGLTHSTHEVTTKIFGGKSTTLHRDSFSGFIQRYAMLKAAIDFEAEVAKATATVSNDKKA